MASLPHDVLKAFGARVRHARLRRDWSQERLALESGLDRSYVGGVERGSRNISAKNIVKLAEALEVSPGDLLKAGSAAAPPRKKASNRRGK